MNYYPGTASGVAHTWVCKRNGSRDKAELGLYDEIELSELVCMHGYGLMGIFIHWNPLGFLQADAVCIRFGNHGTKPQYFVLAIPSRLTGGHGRYSPSESLPDTVCDDIVLRFERKDNNEYNHPTWIAAVYGKEVVELYGDVIDNNTISFHLSEVLHNRLSARNKYDDILSGGERHWKSVLNYLDVS